MPQQAKLYKILGANGEATNGGTGKWFLPHGNRPGRWMPKIKGELIPCENGYHLCRRRDLVHWLGPTIWEAEYRGECVAAEDKVVVWQARLIRHVETWNNGTARLFACDCAEYALGFVKNPDPRSVEAVRVVRLFAIGEATNEELAAARDAAWAAAWAAAGDAAWAAAGDAAWAAARDAAWAAAWDAAWAAARAWMTKRLFQYLDGEVGHD